MVERSEYQKNMEKIINEKLSQIRKESYNGKYILVFGSFPLWNEKICEYIDEISKKMDSHKIIVISEGIETDEIKLNEKYLCKYIQIPHGLENNRLIPNEDTSISCEEVNEILEKQYLRYAVTQTKLQHNQFDKNYPFSFVLWLYHYYYNLLDIIKPNKIVIWNEYYTNHFILNHLAREMNIPVFIMEYGAITGTYSIDLFGSFGKSFPSVCSKEFEKIKYVDEELDVIKSFIEKQKNGKYNQYAQPTADLSNLKKHKGKMPIIVYMGAAHYDSGFVTDEDIIPFNSPMFSSDREVLMFLRNICELRGWLLVYKPHPIFMHNYNMNNVMYIEQCDINELIDIADVVVTVSSKTSYISMIRKKATISLGYSQINFKNIVYEAFEKEEIESKISDALKHGVTDEMETNFIKHLVQIQHYLFDNGIDKSWKFGLPIENAARLLKTPINDSEYISYDEYFGYKVGKYKNEILKRCGKNKFMILFNKTTYVLREIGLLSKQKIK